MTILSNIILILCFIFITRRYKKKEIKSKDRRIAELEGHLIKISIAAMEYNSKVERFNEGIDVLSKVREN